MAIKPKIIFLAALPLILGAATAHAQTFINPLGDRPFTAIILNAIQFLLSIAALVALLAIVIGGVRLTVGGFDNESEAARAKKILLWAVVGLVVTIGSYSILRIVAFQILQVN